ncbi:MAG: hypothetical protein GY850_27115 [bacterium]|nr:hypothetical protein [bacterium]
MNLKSRKILVLTDFFYPDSTGGANKMAYYSSKGLSGTRSRVVIITRKAKSDLLEKQTFNGMNILKKRFIPDLPPCKWLVFV